MKAKAVIIVLLILCIGMGVVLVLGYKQFHEEIEQAHKAQLDLSNNWQKASVSLQDLVKVNIDLEQRYTNAVAEVNRITNELSGVNARLAKTESEAKAAALLAAEELAKREIRIKELDGQKDDLTKRMQEQTVSLGALEKQISDIQKKLDNSEGERDFLLKELKRLRAEKAELEKQFNNLAFVREQVRKLRDELSIAKRLEWLRAGIYGTTQKGAERLQKGFAQTTPAASTNQPNLNVEIHQRGDVKIQPRATNAPPVAPTNAPPK